MQRRERFYPTGTLDLLIQLDSSSRSFRIVNGQPAGAGPASCLAGLLVAPLVIETPAQTSTLVGVTLTPAGAAALFDVPLHEVTGSAIALDELIGAEAARLADRLFETRSGTERVRLMARWVSARIASRPPVEVPVAAAVEEIERTGGRLRIAEVHTRMNVSPKRFTRSFERQVGVTPKTFARLVRFRCLAHALSRTDIPLSEAAHGCGYYDQAHLNAEFRTFAGMTPGQFRTAEHFPGSSSVAA